MMYPVNQAPAGEPNAFRRWAEGVFERFVEARREEARRMLARVLGPQYVSALEQAYGPSADTLGTLTYPAVERRGPNRATNVTRLPVKRAGAKAEEPQTKLAVAGGGKG